MKLPSGRLDFSLLHDPIAAGVRVAIVTPNRRLAIYLKRKYDETQRGAGRLAWDAADILPLATYLERTYRALSLRSRDSALPPLLTGLQCQLVWEDIVRASKDREGLLSVPQAAKQALKAWQLAHAWRLLPALRSFTLHEDSRVFMTWVQRYQGICREKNWIDAAVLADALMTSLMASEETKSILPAQLFIAGFDIVTPQQQHFIDACRRAGVDTQVVTPDVEQASGATNRLEFANETEELRACAVWARQRLALNTLERIAIVVPDLGAKRGRITRALVDALLPLERTNIRDHRSQTSHLFNVSLGQPLSDYALVHDALSLIEFSQHRAMPFSQVSALLRSPYIADAESEIAARAALDGALREIVAPEISLFSLQKKLKLANRSGLARAAARCEKLCACIDRLAELTSPSSPSRAESRAQPSPQDWGWHFASILNAWGFPGEATLDSVEYQVLVKFRNALESVATLRAVQPRMKAEQVLAQLRRLLGDTVFQPEFAAGIDPPIQVLGILESAGQRFDALWVTGLIDEVWPLGTRPIPFIPAILQRSAGVTEASASASLALDQRITDGWRASAAEVVFSHAITEPGRGESEQSREASALIRNIPISAVGDVLNAVPPPDFAEALQERGTREAIPDMPFEVLPVPTTVHGGASVIRDQAACPFRAFARHRLSARSLVEPHLGLDAAERGTLLHRALSLVWGHLASHANLVSLDESQVADAVHDAVTQAIAEARTSGTETLGGRFAGIEQTRLCGVIKEWLDYERERTPFEVVERERKRLVALAGLSMNLRLDRLDRLADGTHALIDYKTGAAKVGSWLGERLDEPQLPLYFVTSEQPITALAFARVKRGERGKVFGFEGVSVVENLLPDVAPIEQMYGMEKKGYVSWDVLIQEWESSLGALAKDFAHGAAQVDPKHGGLTCAQCDLQSVCRIAEVSGYAARNIDAGDAVDGAAADE